MRRSNYALRIKSREEFIRTLTSDMPVVPDHFTRCSEINRAGPALMRDLIRPVPVEPKSLAGRIQADDAIFLDVRSYLAFSGMHIPGAWHIDLSGSFATQAGWVLPPDKDIILVVEDRKQSDEAALQLHRVGFDRVTGYIDGGMLVWGTAALPISRVPVISPEEAHALIRSNEAVLIDVRSREEWEAAHVEGSIHIPWHDLRTRYTELDPKKQYIVMCRGGQRASIAASILKRHGIGRIYNLGGGYTAYKQAGSVG